MAVFAIEEGLQDKWIDSLTDKITSRASCDAKNGSIYVSALSKCFDCSIGVKLSLKSAVYDMSDDKWIQLEKISL